MSLHSNLIQNLKSDFRILQSVFYQVTVALRLKPEPKLLRLEPYLLSHCLRPVAAGEVVEFTVAEVVMVQRLLHLLLDSLS